MKKTFYIFLISLFHLFSVNLLAQPATPYAPNFQVTDMDGVPHNLHTFLDEGRTVVLEFFTVNSPVTLNSREAMTILQDTYGTEGDFSMMFFGIEMDTFNTGETQFIDDYSITYPIIDDLAPMGNLYGADVNTPMFIIICPDRLWKVRYGSLFDDTSLILGLSNQCEDLSEHVLDGKILKYIGEEQFCNGELRSEFYIQNYSDSIFLSSAVISAWNDTIYKGSTVWNGYLAPYTIDTVSFDLFNLDTLQDITFRLDSINNIADTYSDNNSFERTFEEGPQSGMNFRVDVFTDYHPEETTWYIENPSGDIIYTSLQYWPNTLNTVNLSYNQEGCYKFIIEDSFGDGILSGNTPDGPAAGYVHVTNHLGDTIFNENDFEAGTSQRFSLDFHLSTEEFEQATFEVHPNPSNGIVHIDLGTDLTEGQLTIYSTIGKIVYKEVLNANSFLQINTAKWAKGLYIIELNNGLKTSSQKLIVN